MIVRLPRKMGSLFYCPEGSIMNDTAVYIVTGVLAVVALILFMRMGSSKSLTQDKAEEVRRKRAALIAKRKAEAKASLDAERNGEKEE